MERRTRQRSSLEQLLARTTGFRSAKQLHAMLSDTGESVALATVYRLVQSMAHEGELDVLRSQDSETLYRRCERRDHHHHLVCRDCGYAVEVAGATFDRWASRIAREHDFADVTHSVEFLGICPDCHKDPQSVQ